MYLAIFSDLVPQHGLGLCRSAGAQPFGVANQDHLPTLFSYVLSPLIFLFLLLPLPLTSLPLTSPPQPHRLDLPALTSPLLTLSPAPPYPTPTPTPSSATRTFPYLHTSIPSYLHTSMPPYLHTSMPPYRHTSIPPLPPLPPHLHTSLPCNPALSVSFSIEHVSEYIAISSDVLREESWP